jgi:hypothetical protein
MIKWIVAVFNWVFPDWEEENNETEEEWADRQW